MRLNAAVGAVSGVVLMVPFAAWAGDAAPPAPEPVYINSTAHTFRLDVADPASVASAKLFVTEDGGKTWRLAHEEQAAAGAKEAPRFRFETDHDGSYGFMTSVTYADHQSEPEPRPGLPPQLMLVVDTVRPSIADFTAAMSARTPDQATLQARWSVRDDHLATDAVTLECSRDGTTFTPLARGGADAAATRSVALPADATALTVRLVAKDLAGNQMISDALKIDLTAVPAPANAEALAQALRDLPRPEAANASGQPQAATKGDPQPVAVPLATANPEAKPEAKHEKRTGRVLAAPLPKIEYRFLSGERAAAALAAARAAASAGDFAAADGFYRELHNSTMAVQAIPEHLQYLDATGHQSDGLELVAQLPPEQRTDAVRLEQGRMLKDLKRYDEAMAVLGRIGRGYGHDTEAMYLIAHCMLAQDNVAGGRRVLGFLARAEGPIGEQARQELAQLPPPPAVATQQ